MQAVEPIEQPSSAAEQADNFTYEIPGGEDYMPLRPSRRSWEISREHVEVIKVIGKGAFSDVVKATLRNIRDNQEIITVAAKMLKGEVVVLDLSLYDLVNLYRNNGLRILKQSRLSHVHATAF